MADTEEPQFHSLKDRIAALNKQQNFKPAEPVRKPSAPAVPGRPSPTPTNGSSPVPPPRPVRSTTAPPPLPRRDTGTSQDAAPQEARKGPPPLPRRDTETSQASQGTPVVPHRPVISSRKSTQHLKERRDSTSSELSIRSTGSTVSQAQTVSSVTSHGSVGRRLPPPLNETKLPPLPPSRRELEAQAQAAKSAKPRPVAPTTVPKVPTAQRVGGVATAVSPAPAKPSLPPRLPSRPAKSPGIVEETETAEEVLQPQRPHVALRSNTFMGFGDSAGKQPPKKSNGPITGFSSGKRGALPSPGERGAGDLESPPIPQRPRADEPPPVPVASRPSLAQIEAVKARGTATGSVTANCFRCRDWSRPDQIASLFPVATLPRKDPVGYLARSLCEPFPSYTDKARAIFTWFHHNIAYDTAAFFGNKLKKRSPEDTIFSGLAVCEGYAVVYAAIAKKAGLQCEVVTGHGKGFGYTPLKPGERPPPAKADGHAWNAVRIDGGSWKLLDACWGAGHVDGATQSYTKHFSPCHFERDNDVFAETHFPKESRCQYRDDGRVQGWDEYYVGPFGGNGPTFFSADMDLDQRTVAPRQRGIPVHSGELLRFQFSRICEHAKDRKDKSVVYILCVRDDLVPFETDGYWYWLDVHAKDLGDPGQTLRLGFITSMEGKEVQGLTKEEFLEKKGKVELAYGFAGQWDLV
ncbi:unnamed protein product [Clonostachys solani]|uniref:Transglutaminase-like domain-containing protein n=1 Tax=Clonostachys solani TaxID=160281 RepID=A0A9P0EIP6_9HYPO|nr:unnamed protein product [Clonostachys solani]